MKENKKKQSLLSAILTALVLETDQPLNQLH